MFNCRKSFTECDCDCHEFEGMMHFMPCCDECPICHVRLRFAFDAHYELCKKENSIKE